MVELDGDKVKEGGWNTTVSILVNRIPKDALRKAILKLKKGDTLRLNARELEESPKEEMYRKYILNLPENDDREVGDHFEAVIENVSRVAPVELDEAFLQKTFGPDVKTEAEAIEALKKDVARFYEMRANALVMRDIQKRLLELNHFDLPVAFLKRWLQSNNENLTPAQIEEEFEPFAENLRWSLLRDKLVAQFGINTDDEAVRNVFRARVRSYFQVDLPDDLIDSTVARMMEKEEDVDKVRRDLEYDKLYEAMSTEVTLVDKPIASAEFHQIFDTVQG
jgi:trigger factor